MRVLKWIVLWTIFLLAGCQTEPPALHGYVVNIADNHMLVVSKTAQDFSATGGVSEFYNAISFSYEKINELRVGDTVDVWADAVAESYPGQAVAQKVKIYKPLQPNGADLNEQQIIEQGLSFNKTAHFGFPIIKEVHYDAKLDQWKLVQADGRNVENEIILDIVDK